MCYTFNQLLFMKGIRNLLLLIIATTISSGVNARGIESVINSLKNHSEIEVDAKFTVSMPQLGQDVVYSLTLTSLPAVDTLLFPCSYLIDWTLQQDTPRHGFSAYYSGNHFRYGGDKIQEYHASLDSVPFVPQKYGAVNAVGVQSSAQFVNLLPVSIAETLEKLVSDSSTTALFIPDTIVGGTHVSAIRAISMMNGEVGAENEFILDKNTLFPKRILTENSPGSIGEQTVLVEFDAPRFQPKVRELNEQVLIALYPEPFTLMRRSSFSLENLKNRPLPGFSIPTPTGERYSRMAGDAFAATTVLALIDPAASFAPAVVDELRQAVEQSPVPVNLILAFTSNNADLIEDVAGTPLPGEAILQSARSLSQDFGAAQLPSMLIVDTAGIVKDIIVGYNNGLSSNVIQKIALINN